MEQVELGQLGAHGVPAEQVELGQIGVHGVPVEQVELGQIGVHGVQAEQVEPGQLGVHGAQEEQMGLGQVGGRGALAASPVEEEAPGPGRGTAVWRFYPPLSPSQMSSMKGLLGWWGLCLKECPQ